MEYIDICPVLSIAGSDCSGGAGIQADIKTILANGCYAMTAITALTAQNTTGVQGIMDVSPDFLQMQIRSVFDDILPKAVKIGMVSSCSLIEVIVSELKRYHAKNIVVDPVMVSTSGSKLLQDDSLYLLKETLLPLATIITPNIPEAELLIGEKIISKETMENATKMLAQKYNGAVLIKGGHSIEDANDCLVYDGNCIWMEGERIQNPNTHGTGCTLSSAIASNLAKGLSIEESVRNAKAYISKALSQGINLGRGSGPLNHGFQFVD